MTLISPRPEITTFVSRNLSSSKQNKLVARMRNSNRSLSHASTPFNLGGCNFHAIAGGVTLPRTKNCLVAGQKTRKSKRKRKKRESRNDGTRKDARLLRSNFSTADPLLGSSTSSDDEGGLRAYTKSNLSRI